MATHMSGSSHGAGMSSSVDARPVSCKSVCQAAVMSCLLFMAGETVGTTYKVSLGLVA